MKKYAATLVAALFLGVNIAIACHIPPNPPSCPECPPGSTIVDIDFDDYMAGTLLGSNDPTNSNLDYLQRYTSANNTTIAALGEDLGFTIDITNNKGPVVDCKEVEVGALYDTDSRLYKDANGNVTTSYYQAVTRDDDYVARASDGEDPDLETTGYYNDGDEYSQWSGGNMQDYNLGNALIIQEHIDHNDYQMGHLDKVQGKHESNKCDPEIYAPDDDYNGGYITFEFESAMAGFGFSFADLDIGEIYDTTLTFFDTSGTSVEVAFSDFSNGSFDNSYSGDVVWGNNKANRIDTISVSQLNDVMNTDLSNFGKVEFKLSGSGGITSINYCHYNPVPEASTYVAGFGLLALLGFHFLRIKKKK